MRAGYSEDTAYSIGQRLLKNVEIQKRIKEMQDMAKHLLDKIGCENLRRPYIQTKNILL
ncbi:MAG: terminase small subunit [Tannerella sp.]|nr:terminase small subunit [Tannerella sp.]